MEFRTEIKLNKRPSHFQQRHKILMLGSCFSENIGRELQESGFDVIINPMGILFNPVSIEENLRKGLSKTLNEALILKREGHYFHYSCHSHIKAVNTDKLINEICEKRQEMVERIKAADHLVLTFGTAWVYRHLMLDAVVANCHKIPQKEFQKELLTAPQMVAPYKTLFNHLKSINPSLQILLTVSPVRHIKNGLHENNLSKAQLLLLVHELESTFDHVSYFPAYELVLDDLRDYRFFEKDMIHPNQQAIDYVFERFSATYFDEKTVQIAKLSKKIRQLEHHRPNMPNPDQEFLQSAKLKELKSERLRLMKK